MNERAHHHNDRKPALTTAYPSVLAAAGAVWLAATRDDPATAALLWGLSLSIVMAGAAALAAGRRAGRLVATLHRAALTVTGLVTVIAGLVSHADGRRTPSTWHLLVGGGLVLFGLSLLVGNRSGTLGERGTFTAVDWNVRWRRIRWWGPLGLVPSLSSSDLFPAPWRAHGFSVTEAAAWCVGSICRARDAAILRDIGLEPGTLLRPVPGMKYKVGPALAIGRLMPQEALAIQVRSQPPPSLPPGDSSFER